MRRVRELERVGEDVEEIGGESVERTANKRRSQVGGELPSFSWWGNNPRRDSIVGMYLYLGYAQ